MTRAPAESTPWKRPWAAKARRLADKSTARFVCALAAANAPFWLLSHGFFMSRAVVNVDLALAICVLPFSMPAGVALLCVAWCGDLILSQSMTFHFRSPFEFVQSVRYASTLELREFASWDRLLLLIPFAASVGVVARIAQRQRGLWRPAVVVTLLMVCLDATNGSSMLAKRDNWRIGFNMAGSPWSTLGLLALKGNPTAAVPLRPLAVDETVQGLVDIQGWAHTHPTGSVLFVLVESMGTPTAPELREWLSRQLVDSEVESRYVVRQADLPFRGSTTFGELRAMCALSGSYGNMNATHGAGCLPSRLAALGWTTIGMHGFSQRMFDRETWWPMIGLQLPRFVDSPEFGNARCGAAFRGGCDDRLIAAGVQALKPGKRFVYLLTLNTHLPLEAGKLSQELTSICARLKQDAEVCNLVSRLGGVLRQIRTGIQSQHSAPLVVVLGDHAPPFASRVARGAFALDKVPAFALLPRE